MVATKPFMSSPHFGTSLGQPYACSTLPVGPPPCFRTGRKPDRLRPGRCISGNNYLPRAGRYSQPPSRLARKRRQQHARPQFDRRREGTGGLTPDNAKVSKPPDPAAASWYWQGLLRAILRICRRRSNGRPIPGVHGAKIERQDPKLPSTASETPARP